MREPAAFLMDEPLSNLDARLRLTMRGEIKRLSHRLGTTTIYVTHDQAEALTMADLVAVMRDGELQQLAPPSEIYDRPANRFVATFVGSPPMNVLRPRVDDDRHDLVVGGVRLSARRRALRRLRRARRSSRSASVPRTSRSSPRTPPGALRGEVYVVEPMGNETLVEVLVGRRAAVRARARRASRRHRIQRSASSSTARDGVLLRRIGAIRRASRGGIRARFRARSRSEDHNPGREGGSMSTGSPARRRCGARRLLVAALGAVVVAMALVACGSDNEATTARGGAGGKVVIGAFSDGGLTPFKEKIIPLAKEAGFDVQFLEDEYDVTLEKWFADAQSGAGQYDIYLLDDPWVPQFGAAGVLEDLGAAGVDGDERGLDRPDDRHGLLAAARGPARQGLRGRRRRR